MAPGPSASRQGRGPEARRSQERRPGRPCPAGWGSGAGGGIRPSPLRPEEAEPLPFPPASSPPSSFSPSSPCAISATLGPSGPPKGSCRPGLRGADPQAECGRPRGRGGCCSGCRPWPPGPRARGAGRRRPRCQVTGAPAARARAPSSPAPRRREDAPRPGAAEAGTAGGFFPASREAPPAGAACAGGRPNLASRSLGLLWSLLALGLFMIL